MSINPISKFFIVLAVLAVGLITVSFVSQPKAVSTADRSYDSVEQMRSQRLSHLIVPSFVYDQIEELRADRGANSPAVDSSYDLIERLRAARWDNADHSYEKLEALRLQR
jgi:hypothetical protein